MRVAFDRILRFSGFSCSVAIAVFLSAFAFDAQAQNRCSATGVMGTEKFAANNCAVALYEHSVAIWFNETPISAQEAAEFQSSAEVDDKKDGKQRTLAKIMFCPGGGGTTVSATAVKTIDLHTNHAKSPLVGIQWVVKSPKDFKVVKLTGENKPGGALAGNIVGNWGKTKFNFDFDVKLPSKEASSGVGCGK